MRSLLVVKHSLRLAYAWHTLLFLSAIFMRLCRIGHSGAKTVAGTFDLDGRTFQRSRRGAEARSRSSGLLTYIDLAPAVRADRTFNALAGGRCDEQLAIRAALAAVRRVPVPD